MSALNERQIELRRPVWIALSDLWLDTELTDTGLQHIARVLAESGLSIEELRQIYLNEVAPVVWLNSLSVAGVWDGFDEEWLCAEIVKLLQDTSLRSRIRSLLSPRRWLGTYSAEKKWQAVVKLLERMRGQGA